MNKVCPHCNHVLSATDRIGIKHAKKGTITPIRRCPACKQWYKMKTSYVIVEDVFIVILFVTGFFRVVPIIVVPFVFIAILVLFSLYAPLVKHNKTVLNIDNVRIEGKID